MDAPILFSAIEGSAIDRTAGIIRGVSVITEGIAEGHGINIDGTTLKQVKALAEKCRDGVQVKVDHGTGFASIVGSLKNFRIEGSKLLADLHLLKSHPGTEHIYEVAEAMPGNVGLSISFSQTVEEIEGKDFARCEKLFSVDFVDRPAANPSGLFKSVDSPPNVMDEKTILEKIKALFSDKPEPVNFEAKAKEFQAELTAKISELASKDAEIVSLKAGNAKLTTDFTAAQAKLATFDAEVEKKASDRALSIVSAQGAKPPITQTPSENPAAPETKTELKGLDKAVAAFASQIKGK